MAAGTRIFPRLLTTKSPITSSPITSPLLYPRHYTPLSPITQGLTPLHINQLTPPTRPLTTKSPITLPLLHPRHCTPWSPITQGLPPLHINQLTPPTRPLTTKSPITSSPITSPLLLPRHYTPLSPITQGLPPLHINQLTPPTRLLTTKSPITSSPITSPLLHPHHYTPLSAPTRPITTTNAVLRSKEEPGRLKKFVKKMGWLDHSKAKLRRSGYLLFESACGNIMTTDFFEVFDLPDTFYSWFLVLELHVWMLMVRLMAEGEEGRYTRNAMLEAMWEDCETRSKKLGAASLTIRQQQIQMLGSSFQATLFSYDEGLMTSDCVLASALWRRLFSKECSDPERLECCINFIRRQIAELDNLSRDELLVDTKVTWVPLLEKGSPNTVSFRNLQLHL